MNYPCCASSMSSSSQAISSWVTRVFAVTYDVDKFQQLGVDSVISLKGFASPVEAASALAVLGS